jgi:hypothetical protein
MYTCSLLAVLAVRITVWTASRVGLPAGAIISRRLSGTLGPRECLGPGDVRVSRVRRECPWPRAFAPDPRSSDAGTFHL